ncbi:MAG: methionyl-tRNA formyltransferase [Oscillospiraceae bacterium]|nr:methionyl-tRNA formyltransferase [Oscillospiraceae bacterium]
MRIVFMGTPEFAVPSLERLYHDGHDVSAVFTQPDKKRNRGMNLSFSPVKQLAIEHSTPVYQPESLKDGEALEILRKLECELIAVVAYGKLLPREILELPSFGCVNIHGSLLPKYRGAAPIQWAVINGETETGVTSMFMAEELDAGDMLFCGKTAIGENETSGDLHDRLSILGAELLSETVTAILRGEAVRIPQDSNAATFAPPLHKNMSSIDWADTALNIKNKIRGLNPWPTATAEFSGKTYKIFTANIQFMESARTPGTIVSEGAEGVAVACADGVVMIKELQAPGGKRMAASDFLRGNSICL